MAKNYEASNHLIADIIGLSFSKNFTVYITHPSLKNGKSISDGKIEWGHKEEWPNYTTIYLWHEILHSYLPHDDLSHAIIQLITDNELRILLNGGRYPPFEGHEDLFPIMKKLLPYWKRYIVASGDKDILAFRKLMRKRVTLKN